MKNIFQKFNRNTGQHIAEFLVLFLAVCIAFVGTRLYLRRGINAKLKLIEDQLNSAVSAGPSFNEKTKPVNWYYIFWPPTQECKGSLNMSENNIKLLACQAKIWSEKHCPMRGGPNSFCTKYGICTNSCNLRNAWGLGITTTWPDGSEGTKEIGICDNPGPQAPWCVTGPGPNPCAQECKTMIILH